MAYLVLSLNYYNENDLKAAQWLRDLIWAGAISDGEVDTRSIEDVTPNDLSGYQQCHFFAGIGGWSLALRLAGWPDDEPVWTGSCPCQPFSAAGKGGGFTDERHLWPAFHWLIQQSRPICVFGEQVASKDGLAWFDLVSTDLEGADYAWAAADLCAAGVGAPHIRQRLYWLGHSNGGRRSAGLVTAATDRHRGSAEPAGSALWLADANGARYQGWRGSRMPRTGEGEWARTEPTPDGCNVGAMRLADADKLTSGQRGPQSRGGDCGSDAPTRSRLGGGIGSSFSAMGDTNFAGSQGWGQRRNGADKWPTWEASLVSCRDRKWRPVEPGTFPLAHGVPGRVGLLRGYGNAIVPQVAAEFIGAYLDTL